MYDKQYYKKHELGSYVSAKKILGLVKEIVDFKSVIDFGCGIGTWGKALSNISNSKDYFGIDQHQYNQDIFAIPQKQYLQYDLTKALNLHKKFDLAISVEVAEHIDKEYSNIFIHSLCAHSDIILFSAAIPYQGGDWTYK